jgi:hypothetical protein
MCVLDYIMHNDDMLDHYNHASLVRNPHLDLY